MVDQPESREGTSPSSGTDPARPRSSEEARVWEVLEEARQQVKHIVKREMEAEVITSDILNIRLKIPR